MTCAADNAESGHRQLDPGFFGAQLQTGTAASPCMLKRSITSCSGRVDGSAVDLGFRRCGVINDGDAVDEGRGKRKRLIAGQ